MTCYHKLCVWHAFDVTVDAGWEMRNCKSSLQQLPYLNQVSCYSLYRCLALAYILT